jgi:hypothetical protein
MLTHSTTTFTRTELDKTASACVLTGWIEGGAVLRLRLVNYTCDIDVFELVWEVWTDGDSAFQPVAAVETCVYDLIYPDEREGDWPEIPRHLRKPFDELIASLARMLGVCDFGSAIESPDAAYESRDGSPSHTDTQTIDGTSAKSIGR